MPTEPTEIDALEYIREHLKDMEGEQLTRLALAAGVTSRTLYNVMKAERDVKYGTVKKVHKALKDAQAAAEAAGK